MKSFICILLALFQFTIFTAIGAVGEPPLHELPLNLSVSDAGVRDSTSRMSVVEYKFKPKSLILPASLITVGAIGTVIDGMNDFHLFSRKDSVKKIRIDDYMEWGMLGWVFVCDLMGKEKHNWVDQLCLVAIAEGFNAAMTRTVKYTVGEILRLLEGNLAPVACVDDTKDACTRADECVTMEVWREIKDAVNKVVDNITLADLVEQQRQKCRCCK